MSLYLMLAEDDAASAASLVLYAGETIDEFVHCARDLGGEFHALVALAGPEDWAGLLTLPDENAAIAFSIVQRTRGRRVRLLPAVNAAAFGTVVARIADVTLPSPGDDIAGGQSDNEGDENP